MNTVKHRECQGAAPARRATDGILVVRRGSGTQPARMHRRSNASVFMGRDMREVTVVQIG